METHNTNSNTHLNHHKEGVSPQANITNDHIVRNDSPLISYTPPIDENKNDIPMISHTYETKRKKSVPTHGRKKREKTSENNPIMMKRSEPEKRKNDSPLINHAFDNKKEKVDSHTPPTNLNEKRRKSNTEKFFQLANPKNTYNNFQRRKSETDIHVSPVENENDNKKRKSKNGSPLLSLKFLTSLSDKEKQKSKTDSLTLTPKDMNPETDLVIKVVKGLNIPGKTQGLSYYFASQGLQKSLTPYVKIRINNEKQRSPVANAEKGEVMWNCLMGFKNVSQNDQVLISVHHQHPMNVREMIGRTSISIKDLIEHPSIDLLLSDYSNEAVSLHSKPSFLQIKITNVPSSWPNPKPKEEVRFKKEVMILSRGTQGDVQPFVALARGLAELLEWSVTIVTELSYKNFIKSNAQVSKGRIRFRPSGGDTMSQLDSFISQWALNKNSDLLQAAILARSEGQFFPSEPSMFHWAEQMKPDLLVFGFTITNIALVISEALAIPLIGFILQPACIPSKQYAPIVSITPQTIPIFKQMQKVITDHSTQKYMKTLMESNPFGYNLRTMRIRRGLKSFEGIESKTWKFIKRDHVPLVIPIDEFCFGGKPVDYHPNIVFTEFIFLRKGGIPPLEDDLIQFIKQAKQAKEPVVVMAFSSMPVTRSKILEIATLLITECKHHLRIIALVGKRDQKEKELSHELLEQTQKLVKEGKLIEKQGAPFGTLFPLVDCAIIHGGLGTTAEALRIGIPVIVTGVLLMDQRLWGSRVHQLGAGPEPVHINDFDKVCVSMMDNILVPGSTYIESAKKVSEVLKSKSDDGVKINVEAIEKLAQNAKVFNTIKHVSEEEIFENQLETETENTEMMILSDEKALKVEHEIEKTEDNTNSQSSEVEIKLLEKIIVPIQDKTSSINSLEIVSEWYGSWNLNNPKNIYKKFIEIHSELSQKKVFEKRDVSDYIFVYVFGIYVGKFPGAEDAKVQHEKRRQSVSNYGIDLRMAPVFCDGSVRRNATALAKFMKELYEEEKKEIVLIGYSKGGVDATAAISLFPELIPITRCLICMQTPFLGSSVATALLNTSKMTMKLVRQLIKKTLKCDPVALEDLTIQKRLEFLDSHPYPHDAVPTISFVANAAERKESITSSFMYRYQKLLHGEDHDGAVSLSDAIIPGSQVIIVDGLDHYGKCDSTQPFLDSTLTLVALIVTAIKSTHSKT